LSFAIVNECCLIRAALFWWILAFLLTFVVSLLRSETSGSRNCSDSQQKRLI
jgi:hypothetical protein